VAKEGIDWVGKSEVTTAAALAGTEEDITAPPIVPDAMSAKAAAEANIRLR